MKPKDKMLFVIMIVLIILLFIKSFALDNYKPKNDLEADFKIKIEEVVKERYSGNLYKIVKIRIVKISEMSEKERTSKDKDGNVYFATGTYKAKIRKYILGVLPFSEETILDVNLE